MRTRSSSASRASSTSSWQLPCPRGTRFGSHSTPMVRMRLAAWAKGEIKPSASSLPLLALSALPGGPRHPLWPHDMADRVSAGLPQNPAEAAGHRRLEFQAAAAGNRHTQLLRRLRAGGGHEGIGLTGVLQSPSHPTCLSEQPLLQILSFPSLCCRPPWTTACSAACASCAGRKRPKSFSRGWRRS